MRCDAFERRMQQLLDERRAPEYDSSLAAHAAICTVCGELLQAQRELLATLDRSARDADDRLTHGFSERVVALARRESGVTAGDWSRSEKRWAAAIGAAILLGLLGARQIVTYWAGPGEVIVLRPQSAASVAVRSESNPLSAPSQVAHGPSAAPRVNNEQRGALYSFAYRATSFPNQHRNEMDQLAGELRPLSDPLAAAWAALQAPFRGSGVAGQE